MGWKIRDERLDLLKGRFETQEKLIRWKSVFLCLLFGLTSCAVDETARTEQKYSDFSMEACLSLEITEADIRAIIAQSPLVRGEVWHYHHHAAPCSH